MLVGELARVAQRTFDQRQIVINNLAIRRATEELKAADDYEQIRRVLEAAFNSNDFDGFDVRFELSPGESHPAGVRRSGAQARRGEVSFYWGESIGRAIARRFGALDSIARSGEFVQPPPRCFSGPPTVLAEEPATGYQSAHPGLPGRAGGRVRSYSPTRSRGDPASRCRRSWICCGAGRLGN